MNKAQFFDQLTESATQYDRDNAWFGFQRGGPKWSQGTWIQFILAAWKLYQRASTNQLRSMQMSRWFGATSAKNRSKVVIENFKGDVPCLAKRPKLLRNILWL